MRTINLIAAQFLVIAVIGGNLYSQSPKDKEKKPQTTADAWREALPQAETSTPATLVPEESRDNVEGKESAAQTEKRILELEHRLMESLKSRDLTSLGFLLADDFVLSGLELAGTQSDKERYIRWATGQLQLRSYDVEKVLVRAYPATAVVTLKYKRQASIGDSPSDGDFTVTNVWVRREKLWRITSHHISQIPVL
ncbi:MAG: nuclear transport factor 2 family protein [Pyrinomonadaceae bacterium]